LLIAYADLLTENILAFLVFFGALATALLVGISFHEASHAIVADTLGDPTARRAGRVSLNPLAHLDPAGTALLFLVGFGWGKPVPVDARYFRRPAAGMATVAAAGPISNFAIAGLAGFTIKADWVEWVNPFLRQSIASWQPEHYAGLFLTSIVLISIILGVFNLIPLLPLDGHRVVPAFLDTASANAYLNFQARYGFIILIALIGMSFLTGFGLFQVMAPVIRGLARLFAGVDSDVFG
jgi:Zn-dependent protease